MKKLRLFHKILFVCALCLILPFTVWADTGSYYGTATITAPANLGTIDLAFTFDVAGTVIQPGTSYIMSDKTLLFPVVLPQLGGKDVGARVLRGNLTPTSFDLTTDLFSSTVSAPTDIGTILVTRQVILDNAKVDNGGNTLSGNYTETVSFPGQTPYKVQGTFILVRPTTQTVVNLMDLNSDGWIDINEIRSTGASATVMEFSDISQALHFYYNQQPTQKPKIGSQSDSSGQQTIKDALTEFYATQKQ